ncbi:MBL fold metallo-hydrolase [Halovivax limisalsi]|uniref:MBL fold metallo-hydrolase n=1 Tax=Halovivax limisalsi TaxID=1453760 RepID=UPI001FFD5289|nr:MBL fold metallo-hydrolase [Halovivax limisalsi]
MELRFLGGAREVGRSAICVDDRLLLDFGADSGNPPKYPIGDPEPDAVVVSHGHLDHVGSIPTLLSGADRPPVHWTPPTRDLALLVLRDTLKLRGGTYDCPFTRTEIARLTQVSTVHGYREPFSILGGADGEGYDVTFYDAGHIPGSAHVLVDDGETRLLYAGDFNTDDQRLLAGTSARPDADAVITESTYAETTRAARETVEADFVESVQQTIWEGGTVVVPAFAIGRTQEVLASCAAHGIDCYVDGMGTRVTELLRRPANEPFLRDSAELARASANARVVDGRDGQRRRIAEGSNVIVTTSGMLHGGPAMTYVPAIRSNPINKIAFTGYQVAGSPGRELLDTGRVDLDGTVRPVSARVEAYDFSAHADREGLRTFLEPYRDARVLCVHGDRCEAFAERLGADGFDAAAPALGDVIRIADGVES